MIAARHHEVWRLIEVDADLWLPAPELIASFANGPNFL
jgi:hypothetical protein